MGRQGRLHRDQPEGFLTSGIRYKRARRLASAGRLRFDGFSRLPPQGCRHRRPAAMIAAVAYQNQGGPVRVALGRGGDFLSRRIDGLAGTAKQARPASDYFRRNVSVTPSGNWSSVICAGYRGARRRADPVLDQLSVPFHIQRRRAPLLRRTDLSAADKAAIAQGNWERLTENTQRGSQRASSAGRIGGLRFRWSL
jgi:hypothetical protein